MLSGDEGYGNISKGSKGRWGMEMVKSQTG